MANETSPQIAWAYITKNGSISSSSEGVTGVDKTDNGTYRVSFRPVSGLPAVFAQRVIKQSDGSDTRRNCLLQDLTDDSVLVRTGKADGKLTDSDFTFIAIGHPPA